MLILISYLHLQHVNLWVKLLREKWVEGDDWTIMPSDYFVYPGNLTLWSKWAKGIDVDNEKSKIPWSSIEKVIAFKYIIFNSLFNAKLLIYIWLIFKCVQVFIPINIPNRHWVLGELRLSSMTVYIYDSLVAMGCYEHLVENKQISKFTEGLAALLNQIDYLSKENRVTIKPADIKFVVIDDLPQQKGMLGDCGVFMCMWMEQLVSGQPLSVLKGMLGDKQADKACMEYRMRMGKIYLGSKDVVG